MHIHVAYTRAYDEKKIARFIATFNRHRYNYILVIVIVGVGEK